VANDGVRQIFRSEPILVALGDKQFELRPTKLKAIRKLRGILSSLGPDLQESLAGNTWDLDAWGGLLDTFGDKVFEVLQLCLPDLDQEAFEDADFPQLQEVFQRVLEVNGFTWLQRILENLGDRVQAAIQQALEKAAAATTSESSLQKKTRSLRSSVDPPSDSPQPIASRS